MPCLAERRHTHTRAFIALSRKHRSRYNSGRKMAIRSEPNSLNSTAELCCCLPAASSELLISHQIISYIRCCWCIGNCSRAIYWMVNKTDIGSKSSILGNSVFGASSWNTNLLLTFLGSTSICDSCLKFFIKLVNVHPIKGHEGPEGEYSYGSALSFTSALGGGGEATSRNSRLNPGERLPVRIA
jgi:hypothetical protein